MPSVADLVEDHLLRALTDPETYDAGRALADRHAVTFDQVEPMVVKARVVDDAEGYLVDLHVGPGRLAWSCSEPGGSRGLFCSHCVAAAIATRRQAPARPTAMPEVPDLMSSPPPPTPAALRDGPRVEPASGADLLSGTHVVLFSPAADELRAWFTTTLGLSSVDAGNGWPLFALPPAELAVHPADVPAAGLYLLCDDLDATLAELVRRGFRAHTPIHQEAWGRVTELALPGGAELPLYQPRHPRPTG